MSDIYWFILFKRGNIFTPFLLMDTLKAFPENGWWFLMMVISELCRLITNLCIFFSNTHTWLSPVLNVSTNRECAGGPETQKHRLWLELHSDHVQQTSFWITDDQICDLIIWFIITRGSSQCLRATCMSKYVMKYIKYILCRNIQ